MVDLCLFLLGAAFILQSGVLLILLIRIRRLENVARSALSKLGEVQYV